MSHEVWELDRPAYALQPAWHGLGIVLDRPMSVSEGMEAGRLLWQVEAEVVMTKDGLRIPDAQLIARTDLPVSDQRRCLGVVGNRYRTIQNSNLASLAEALFGELGVTLETCGSLKNGRVVWLLARMPAALTIGRSDLVNQYLLLRSSHDGSCSLEALLTAVRVVCWNTLESAVSGRHNRIKVRHTESAHIRIDEARRILGIAQNHAVETVNKMNRLVAQPVEDRWAEAMIYALWPDKEDQNNARAHETRDTVSRLWSKTLHGRSSDTDHTAYGLYNAVTEYLDHHTAPETSKRSARDLAETRFESTLYGTNARKRQESFDLIQRFYGLDGKGVGLIEKVRNAPSATPASVVDDLLSHIDLG